MLTGDGAIIPRDRRGWRDRGAPAPPLAPGQIIPLFALLLPILLGLLCLAVDLATLDVAANRTQHAADQAALAAVAAGVGGGSAAAVTAARRFASLNYPDSGVTLTTTTAFTGTAPGPYTATVTIQTSRLPLVYAGVLGLGGQRTVSKAAMAVTAPPVIPPYLAH